MAYLFPTPASFAFAVLDLHPCGIYKAKTFALLFCSWIAILSSQPAVKALTLDNDHLIWHLSRKWPEQQAGLIP
jgi:hypothetical protein